MDALEAVIRVLIEQAIRGEELFHLDYSDLAKVHDVIREMNVPSIIGDVTPFSSANDSEAIKIKKTVKAGTIEELTENLFWNIVEERREKDPYKQQKLIY